MGNRGRRAIGILLFVAVTFSIGAVIAHGAGLQWPAAWAVGVVVTLVAWWRAERHDRAASAALGRPTSEARPPLSEVSTGGPAAARADGDRALPPLPAPGAGIAALDLAKVLEHAWIRGSILTCAAADGAPQIELWGSPTGTAIGGAELDTVRLDPLVAVYRTVTGLYSVTLSVRTRSGEPFLSWAVFRGPEALGEPVAKRGAPVQPDWWMTMPAD